MTQDTGVVAGGNPKGAQDGRDTEGGGENPRETSQFPQVPDLPERNAALSKHPKTSSYHLESDKPQAKQINVSVFINP